MRKSESALKTFSIAYIQLHAAVHERTKLPDLPFLITDDVIRCLVTFVVYLRTHLLPRRHCNSCQLMPTLALLLQTGKDHLVVQGERGCNKSKRTAGYLFVWRRSQANIARCGDRYTTISWSSAAASEWVYCINTNKNLAIANRSRVSCAHNTLRASIGI